MVTRNYFRLIIIYQFIFFSFISVLMSGDEMNKIEINVNTAFENYKSDFIRKGKLNEDCKRNYTMVT